MKGLSAYSKHANVLLKDNDEVDAFLQKALAATLNDNLSVEDLIALTMETGKYGVSGMAMLDKANTDSYGNPRNYKGKYRCQKEPRHSGIRPRPARFGNAVRTDTGNWSGCVYAFRDVASSLLSRFQKNIPNFVGNYGNAWWKQKEEFESFNGPILMTTNCIVPPKDSYKNRLLHYRRCGISGMHTYSGRDWRTKNFSAIIEHAKKCRSE